MVSQAGSSPDVAVAEAADVLAMLYMARGERDKAKPVVDAGQKILQYYGVKDGYVFSLLRGRLNSQFTASEAKRLYNEAEKLRNEGKFTEAGLLYTQLRNFFPKDPWADAAGFRIGQCFVGLGECPKPSTGGRSSSRNRPPGRGVGNRTSA